jgi:hypothetical protein
MVSSGLQQRLPPSAGDKVAGLESNPWWDGSDGCEEGAEVRRPRYRLLEAGCLVCGRWSSGAGGTRLHSHSLQVPSLGPSMPTAFLRTLAQPVAIVIARSVYCLCAARVLNRPVLHVQRPRLPP